jgi:uncharacterized protein YqgQ
MLTNSCDYQRKREINVIFEQTKKIEIIAYSNRNEWDSIDNTDYYKLNYIKNNIIEIKEKYLKSRIVLNPSQLNKLKNGLINCKTKNWVAACYDPRHSILFYNKKDEVLGFIEICFECNRAESTSNLKFISECALSQEELFKEFGITYFNDTEEEIEELKIERN